MPGLYAPPGSENQHKCPLLPPSGSLLKTTTSLTEVGRQTFLYGLGAASQLVSLVSQAPSRPVGQALGCA